MRRLLILLILLLISCSEKNPLNQDDSTENEGTAVIEAVFSPQGAAKAAEPASTVSASVFFYKGSSLTVTQPLQFSGKRATGKVTVKEDTYRVDLKGYDSSGDVTYFGSTENVTILAGKETTVQIMLQKAIVFVSIPGGTFQMGDIQGGGNIDESPVHTVTVSGFEMSTYEITQAQYESIIGSNPSYFSGYDNLPVERVSWYDAATFCNRLSEQMGLEKCYTESGKWCNDWYGGYTGDSVTNPIGPSSGTNRVIRSPSWFNLANSNRSASRFWFKPTDTDNDIGLRAVRRP